MTSGQWTEHFMHQLICVHNLVLHRSYEINAPTCTVTLNTDLNFIAGYTMYWVMNFRSLLSKWIFQYKNALWLLLGLYCVLRLLVLLTSSVRYCQERWVCIVINYHNGFFNIFVTTKRTTKNWMHTKNVCIRAVCVI